MKRLITIAAVCLMLGGCASSGGYMPVTSDTINEAGEHVVKIGGYTKDASVAKEAEVHNTLRNRDNNYKAAYLKSGTTLTFGQVQKTVKVNGQELTYTETTLTQIVTREAPHFDQPLPTEQSQHPVWGTVKSVGNNLINKTVLGWGISEGTSFLKSLVSTPTYQYQGPVNMANSYNLAEDGLVFEAAAQYQGPVEIKEAEEAEETTNEEEVTE